MGLLRSIYGYIIVGRINDCNASSIDLTNQIYPWGYDHHLPIQQIYKHVEQKHSHGRIIDTSNQLKKYIKKTISKAKMVIAKIRWSWAIGKIGTDHLEVWDLPIQKMETSTDEEWKFCVSRNGYTGIPQNCQFHSETIGIFHNFWSTRNSKWISLTIWLFNSSPWKITIFNR
jgi:hypothetical protein